MAFRLALKFGCTVRELLVRIDSRELAEWQAFERAFGPIDDAWRDRMLIELTYQVQLSNEYFLLANSKNYNGKTPDRYPLPAQLIEQYRGE